ncbi:MAG: IclR family transcriptional regulator [Spirochaetales bacterium]|nr:IclR family transcriptional regulator [Spirochaetales bacterium]
MPQLLSSVIKALEVLEVFTIEHPELSLAEISRRMGAHKSSVYRILRTLEAADFLRWNGERGLYRLSPKILELASRVLARYDLREVAGPPMEELAARTGEIIHLSILDGYEIVYLEKKGAGQVLTVATRVGGRYPAYASAMGKVLLAFLPEQQLQGILEETELVALTPKTITDEGRLKRELAAIRGQGYAVDDEEAFPGIRCVAAPIREPSGRVVAALSATIPAQRLPTERSPELINMIGETASRISAMIIDTERET